MAGPALFRDLDCISEATQEVVASLGFTRTTPVQEAVIPLFCGNKDVAVDACTGSGKTLAFLIPIIEKLRRLEDPLKKHQVGAIIVAPTRELSRQIYNVAQPFAASAKGLSLLLLVGGTDPAADLADFKDRGGQIIVGTPGRIEDVMKRSTVMDLKKLEVLVLDEADRLLDMGFRVQLDAIMARLPKQRRTGLFSATQTEAVQALARAGLRNPVRVNVAVTSTQQQGSKKSRGKSAASSEGGQEEAGQQKTPTGLHITYTLCEVDQKLPQLVRFLQLHGTSNKIIVYCLTCACVDFYALALKRLTHQMLKGVQIKALHGRMKQPAREAMLEEFTKLPAGVLLATDLAARGLDIPEVHWVVQVDPPQDPAAFVHRVGRTARAGRAGAALVLLAPHESSYVEFMRLRKVPMSSVDPLADVPDALAVVKHEAETDREVMEAGMKAFVSYIRGYKEHHCKFIFRIQDLPVGRLATLFALLRLPHMPEVKRVLLRTSTGARLKGLPTCEHFTPSEVDPDTVAFKDKAREKQRQQLLKKRAAEAAEAAAAAKGAKQAGSKKQAGAQAAPKPAAAPESGSRLTAAKRRKLQERDEFDELDKEYKLLKQLKRGKLSEHQFDVATGLTSDSDDDDIVMAPVQGADEAGDAPAQRSAGGGSKASGEGSKGAGGSGGVSGKAGGHKKQKGQLAASGPSRVQQKTEAKLKRKKRKAAKMAGGQQGKA